MSIYRDPPQIFTAFAAHVEKAEAIRPLEEQIQKDVLAKMGLSPDAPAHVIERALAAREVMQLNVAKMTPQERATLPALEEF